MKVLVNMVMNLFLALSCSTASVRYGEKLGPYIDDFEKNCKTKVTIPIELAPLPKGVLGKCVAFRGPVIFRKIQIDLDYWNSATNTQKESTILHELGHCVLDLEHDTTIIGEYYLFMRPKTLMFPYDFPQYEIFRKEYREQFFSQCKKN